MTLQETAAIMTILETAYPRFYANKTEKQLKEAVKLWSTMFTNDDAKIVTEAVKSLICTLKYPPSIADVKEQIALLTLPETMTEMEAWGYVQKALQNSYYHSEEMFNTLPELCRRIVGSPNQLREWATMDSETVNSVIQSNFMRSFKSLISQEKENSMLPESTKKLRKVLSETSNKMLTE